MSQYIDFGTIKDTIKNRKPSSEVKYFPCCDCGIGNFRVEKTTSIIDNKSIIVSGTQPPTGFINKSEWFDNEVRCEECQADYDNEMEEYDEYY